MTKVLHFCKLFFGSYITIIAGIWGFLEAYTYFKDNQLKELLGPYWFVLYGVPVLIALGVAVIGLRKPQKRERLREDVENPYAELLRECKSLDDLLRVAIREIEEATRTDYNQILLSVTDRHTGHLLVVADIIPPHKQRYRIATFEGLLGHSFTTGEVLNVPNVRNESRYFAAVPETNSELVVPIRSDEIIIGVINSESEELAHFGKEISEQVKQIAAELGELLPAFGWSAIPTASEHPSVHLSPKTFDVK